MTFFQKLKTLHNYSHARFRKSSRKTLWSTLLCTFPYKSKTSHEKEDEFKIMNTFGLE